MKVLTDTGLAYYHSKLQNEFISQGSLSTAIDDYLDNVDWTDVLGNTYATQEDVEDMISSADLDAYLPKAGGTMTGAITAGTSLAINRSVNDSWTQLNGGSATADGATLILFGKNENRAGAFQLSANNGTTSKALVGRADGTLQWGTDSVARFDSNNKLVFPNGDTLWFA